MKNGSRSRVHTRNNSLVREETESHLVNSSVYDPKTPKKQNSNRKSQKRSEMRKNSAGNSDQYLSPNRGLKKNNFMRQSNAQEKSSAKKSRFAESAKRNNLKESKENSKNSIYNFKNNNAQKISSQEPKKSMKVKDFTVFIKNFYNGNDSEPRESGGTSIKEKETFSHERLFEKLIGMFGAQARAMVENLGRGDDTVDLLSENIEGMNCEIGRILELKKEVSALESLLLSYQYLESNMSNQF